MTPAVTNIRVVLPGGAAASLPFWELDTVVMTPHSSGWSESTLGGRSEFIAEQLVRLAEGRPLDNVILTGS
jgi:phosphoglycerate dehydrogenase-like enzyme